MFITWRKKVIISNRKTELFHEYSTISRYDENNPIGTPGARWKDSQFRSWAPLWCEHTGPGRIAWTPLLVHAERVDGKPRQKLLRMLPVLRSCCTKDAFTLAAWWHTIDWWMEFWQDTADGIERQYFERDRKAILAKLGEVAPWPGKVGVKAFTAYRERKEAEWKAAENQFWDACRQEQQAREQEEARRKQEDEFRRYNEDFARQFGQNPFVAAPDCWSVLRLQSTATLDQLQTRYCELARKHHPDRGGKAEEFVKIQTAFDKAREILRRR
jgi:hypothetical protein